VLAESEAVLVSLASGPDLTMAEINRVMEQINGKCSRAQIIMGVAVDESFRDRLAVTLIATRNRETPGARPVHDVDGGEDAALRAQLLDCAPAERPHSRFIPPSPALTPEKLEQLMARQAGHASRQRKSPVKMRQGQLPLEIVSRGRFDKSEPTIHKGEDLDVPTYIRRGVALN